MSEQLFSPVNLAGTILSNAMVMAPMTRNRAPDNIPNDLMVEYYSQRASAGLIISEGAQISEEAVGYPATPGIYSDTHIAGWKKVTDAVHAHGGHIFCQLWHCGRVSHPDFHQGELPVAPSAIQPKGDAFTFEGLKPFVTPRALELHEIPTLIRQYVHAAQAAIAAGFDGVEIHSANGYLLDQFLRDGSNQRRDKYGGSYENRSRLLLEIIAAMSEAIGSERIGVRLSPVNGFNDMHDTNPQPLFNYVATALSECNLAYLHVVEVSMQGEPSKSFDIKQLRQCYQGTYIANGGYDKVRAESALAAGDAELIAFGVPFIANPDLPQRLRNNVDLATPDATTFYGGDAHGYTDYPNATL
ncbi:MAG: alkene reductase [Zetaproteobacteria bacterium]|nr:alkene reductase [Zetaproteobacteria bacterium]